RCAAGPHPERHRERPAGGARRLVVDAGERARDAVRQSGDGRRRAEGACDARNAKAPAKGAGAYHAGDLLVVIASPRLALAALRAVARGDAITVRVRGKDSTLNSDNRNGAPRLRGIARGMAYRRQDTHASASMSVVSNLPAFASRFR